MNRAIRVECECGAPLGLVTLPHFGEDALFRSSCPGCGTRHRRSFDEIVRRLKPGSNVVVLNRAQPGPRV